MTSNSAPPTGPARPSAVREWLDRLARGVGLAVRRTVRQPVPLLVGVVVGMLFLLSVQALSEAETPPAIVPGLLDQDPEVTVRLSEGLLTALVRLEIERGEPPVRLEDVTVSTGSGSLVVRGRVALALGRGVDGMIQMEPVVEDGQLRLRVRQARLGPLGVPGNVERLAEGPVNRQIAASLESLPATLTSARADADGLTVTARVRTDELLIPPP